MSRKIQWKLVNKLGYCSSCLKYCSIENGNFFLNVCCWLAVVQLPFPCYVRIERNYLLFSVKGPTKANEKKVLIAKIWCLHRWNERLGGEWKMRNADKEIPPDVRSAKSTTLTTTMCKINRMTMMIVRQCLLMQRFGVANSYTVHGNSFASHFKRFAVNIFSNSSEK